MAPAAVLVPPVLSPPNCTEADSREKMSIFDKRQGLQHLSNLGLTPIPLWTVYET